MVSFETLKFNPKVQGSNPFAPGKVAFTGNEGTIASPEGYSERHGNGKAAGIASNGVIGEVAGCGKDGAFVLDNFYA
ncbi:MAG: hypothetical protein NC200_02450 [Candidatus Gastranaerophilales bacterium]|nr:hypothetical protein [Candidatus Gastranaerophilales bacterium]